MKNRKVTLVASALTLVLGSLGSAQQPDLPTYEIQEVGASRNTLSIVGYWRPVRCDSEGNVYFHVDLGSPRAEKTSIWKISPKAQKLAEFVPPKEIAENVSVPAFQGTPDAFYELAYDEKGTYVLQFEGDGTFAAKVSLATPESFRPDSFAPFRTGDFWVAGHIRGATGDQARPYSAVFSSSGKLVKEVSVGESPKADPSRLSSFAAPGTDGYVYNLVGDHVEVISSSGALLSSFPVHGPDGYRPNNIFVSHGVVSIQFGKVETTHQVRFLFQTYQAASGAPIARYVPSNLPNTPLCFSSEEGYTFSRNANGQFEIVRAWTH
jgi:hypothetical protein